MDDQRTDRKGGGMMRLVRLVALTIAGGLIAYAFAPAEPRLSIDRLDYPKVITEYVVSGAIAGVIIELLVRWRERNKSNPTH
jgi:hypothetical protein